ncbi:MULTISPECIES: hypothetical protein [unclassified Raoultella]|uniref:hypothetical protein n=1 Tax=unclassified Raoultella TaxID=2627600 RepID=UPI001357C6A0|nr:MULTISPECIES: hypothetical protein [unclassified Raoultella]
MIKRLRIIIAARSIRYRGVVLKGYRSKGRDRDKKARALSGKKIRDGKVNNFCLCFIVWSITQGYVDY